MVIGDYQGYAGRVTVRPRLVWHCGREPENRQENGRILPGTIGKILLLCKML